MDEAGCSHAAEPCFRSALLCLYVSSTEGVAHGEFDALLSDSILKLAAMTMPCRGEGCILEALGFSPGAFNSAAECLLVRLLLNERATSQQCQGALSAYAQTWPEAQEGADALARALSRIVSSRALYRADGRLAQVVGERIQALLPP